MQASAQLIHDVHNQLAHSAIRDYHHIINHTNIRLGTMTKKLTVEDFVNRAKVIHGDRYSYLLVQYVNNRTPVKIICPEHGEFSQSPDNHLSGKGCSACAGTKRLDTAEFIRRAIQTHGDRYDYSESIYTTNARHVTIVCKIHGAFKQAPSMHMAGQGCPACGGTKQLTSDQFVEKARAVHRDAYDYSKVDYLNNKTKVEITCPEHGVFRQAPANHLSGKGCPKCAGNVPLAPAEFIEKARIVHGDKYDYSCVEYSRSNRKVTILCPEHGAFSQTPNNHLEGNGCGLCVPFPQPKLTHDIFLSRSTTAHGGKYDYSKSEYAYAREKVILTCPDHGDFEQSPSKHMSGQGCPVCANLGPSKGQTEMFEFIKRYAPADMEVRLGNTQMRMDIFVPERMLAIEYHGLIWHSTWVKDKDPKHDAHKHRIAEALGIRVVHIYEDEWRTKRGVVERLLLSAVGSLPRLHARKTALVGVSMNDANNFYDANHLQGGRQSQINLGLEHNGQLVACMSFDILRSDRNNVDQRHWELVRYASTATIVGGASRLLKAFKLLKKADTLTSYSDTRTFSGGMYRALGFHLAHETAPDYAYVDGTIAFGRKHKSRFQKKYLTKLFPGCDLSKTEWEICEENGLYRLYDCGKKRWDLQIKESSQNGHTSS